MGIIWVFYYSSYFIIVVKVSFLKVHHLRFLIKSGHARE